MAADTIRLLTASARMNVIYILGTRQQAAVGTITDFIYHSGEFAAPLLIVSAFGHVGRWSLTQFAFMLGYATTIAALLDVFEGAWGLSQNISQGEIDHFLLQPHPLWRTLFTEKFAPIWNWPVLLLGVLTLATTTTLLGLAVSPGWLLLLVINLLASVAVKTAYMYAWGSLAFWAPRGAADASQAAAQLAGEVSMPLDTLPRALRGVLVSAVPSGLFAWLPSRALLGLGTPAELWYTPVAAIGLSALAVLLFLLGMRHYRRTGSRRYAGIGQGR